jgi:hypothetical protein
MILGEEVDGASKRPISIDRCLGYVRRKADGPTRRAAESTLRHREVMLSGTKMLSREAVVES